MLGLHIADGIVLILYLAGITLIGIRSARLVSNVGNFFMPRRFGKSVMLMHSFGTGTHSDQAVSVASKTFTNGVSGIWYQWLWLFVTPFYWLIGPMMRRFRAITTADVFAARYGPSVGILFALFGMMTLIVNIGVILKGSGAIISASFGGTVSSNAAIAVMTALFLAYGMAGGLSAAIITDFIQGILTVIFSFILLPFALSAVDGLRGLHEKITDPHMFSLVAPAEIGLFYIVVIALNGLIGIVTQPHTMGNCAAGRTEGDGRFGFTAGNFVKRICTMAWCLTGLAAFAYFSGREIHPDHVYGHMARDFLPAILPGLLGVFLASLVASAMSSCDSFMIASSGLFTENIYKPLMPGRSSRHYLVVGRIAALFVALGGFVFAFRLRGVVEGLEIFWKIPALMGIAFWVGLFWRRATPAGAWAATLAALAMWWLTTQRFFVSAAAGLSWAEPLRLVFEGKHGLEIYLPWQMVLYLSTGTFFGILVSLFTKPGENDKLDRFYELVRTPIGAEEGEPSEPCTIPAGVPVPPKRKLLPIRNLEILVPSRTAITGFVACSACVLALVWGFALIVRG